MRKRLMSVMYYLHREPERKQSLHATTVSGADYFTY
jgi:hypothetical protein